jgi:transcriptional accessory protein Tex/SPT6
MASDLLGAMADEDADEEEIVAEVMRDDTKLEQLDDLDLDEYACWLMTEKNQLRFDQVYRIKEEMLWPFGERRRQVKQMPESAQFSMVTGETPFTLYPGCIVECKVSRITRDCVFVTIDAGDVVGKIPLTDRCQVQVRNLQLRRLSFR